MITVSVQAYRLIVTVFVGFGIAFLYDFINFIGQQGKKNLIKSFLYDLFFWITSIVFSFMVLFKSNYGEIRNYVFLGIAVGFILYRLGLRKYVLRILLTIKYLLKRIACMIGFLRRYIYYKFYITKSKLKTVHVTDKNRN